jgi:hypothetical protein
VSGHELVYFPTEHAYLDHGDDPYSADVRASSAPILHVLIDEAVYAQRFSADATVNLNDADEATLANVGLAATQFQ